MIRSGPSDHGTVTEFKTLNQMTSSAVQRSIKYAARQLRQHGSGDVFIDGRSVGLAEETARHGYQRAHGEHRQRNKAMPNRVTFILADGSGLTLGGPNV